MDGWIADPLWGWSDSWSSVWMEEQLAFIVDGGMLVISVVDGGTEGPLCRWRNNTGMLG